VAVPTFTSVTPAIVHTGGRALVDVRGTGFRVPALPPPHQGAASDPVGPGVEVLLGVEPAELCWVLSETRLLVRVPPSPIEAVQANDYGEGSVDITIRNLDEDGVPIPGEEVVAPGALAYQRAQLADEADFTRIVRTLIRELRRQVIGNVAHSGHPDFDDSPGDLLNITHLATLPGLALVGPRLSENRFYSINEQPSLDDLAVAGERLVYRSPYTVDLEFSLIGVSDNRQELLNLQALATQFFERNPFIQMQRDPNDASAGRARWEMDLTPDGDFKDTSVPNESNIVSFSGTFLIRGFDLEGVAGFSTDAVLHKTAYTDDEGVRLQSEALTED
jgi:hypothetical protein